MGPMCIETPYIWPILGTLTFSRDLGREQYHQIVKGHISGHSFGGSYISAEKHSVYSTAPADWVTYHWKFSINVYHYFSELCIICWYFLSPFKSLCFYSEVLAEKAFRSHGYSLFFLKSTIKPRITLPYTQAVCISHITDTLKKEMNSIILLPPMNK